MAKRPITRVADLVPDPRNANKGTERGSGMLEASLREFGAGRSLLVDRHGVVIAGNKTLEAAAAIGFDDVVVVPTDGSKLIVVQRTDLDLAADPKAKALAVADNRVSQVDLAWDADVLQSLVADGVDLGQLWHEGELVALLGTPAENNYKDHWTEDMPEFVQEEQQSFDKIVVHFASASDRQSFFDTIGQTPRKKFIWFPARAYEKQSE